MARTFYGKILQGYRTLTGSYFSDAQGKLSNVSEDDVRDLVDGGCVDRDMATKAVLGGIAIVSGDAAKVLSGAGTFLTPAAVVHSAGSSGVVQKSDGSGGFAASQITDNGTNLTLSEPLILTSQTSTPGAAAGTISNAPAAGNPQTWLQVSINGVVHWIPAWHA